MTVASTARRVGGALFCLVNLWLTLAFALAASRGFHTHASWRWTAVVTAVLFGYLAVAFGGSVVAGRRLWPIPR